MPGAVLLLSLSCDVGDVHKGGGKISEDISGGTAGQDSSEETC